MSTDKPNWTHWKNLATVTLKEAVALSLDLEPVNTDVDSDEFRARLSIAINHIKSGRLRVRSSGGGAWGGVEHRVTLADFRAWGEALPESFTFPDEFPEAEREASAAPQATSSRWPWGDHDTKLLRKLAAAAERFWKLYDPADISTAPTNETVVKWLKEQGVADRNAQVMATILRADGLPTGPRK